jgi:predicted amidohydrolase YtcJ
VSGFDLVIRNARLESGEAADIGVRDGAIVSLAAQTGGARELDARGALALPGLHDHHLHLFATAARRESVDLGGLVEVAAIVARLAGAAAVRPVGAWLRAAGYDERAMAALPERHVLDAWSPANPLRLQDRTGALWVLNSTALALVGDELPPGAERDSRGHPTGRFWREDAWLRQALPRALPDLAALGADLARLGLTGLTDAGAANDGAAARLLVEAALPQCLTVMGTEHLPQGAGYRRGALKLQFDERDPPQPEQLAARIAAARGQGRAVAAHCVTVTELALYLAALDEAGGARAGDRIEHGSEIPLAMIPEIARRALTVVSNPVLVHDRGERYLATVPAAEQGDLYRAASLAEAGIALAGGSDAPYGNPDPWLAMRTAAHRLTAGGHLLGPDERLAPRRALDLFLGEPERPGQARRIVPGAPADIVLVEGAIADVLGDFDGARVVATVIGGTVAFHRN